MTTCCPIRDLPQPPDKIINFKFSVKCIDLQPIVNVETNAIEGNIPRRPWQTPNDFRSRRIVIAAGLLSTTTTTVVLSLLLHDADTECYSTFFLCTAMSPQTSFAPLHNIGHPPRFLPKFPHGTTATDVDGGEHDAENPSTLTTAGEPPPPSNGPLKGRQRTWIKKLRFLMARSVDEILRSPDPSAAPARAIANIRRLATLHRSDGTPD